MAGGGLDLLVVDPLASFLPGRCESDAASLLEALHPLHRLTARGAAVLLLHHPRKKSAEAGSMARGSGALLAHRPQFRNSHVQVLGFLRLTRAVLALIWKVLPPICNVDGRDGSLAMAMNVLFPVPRNCKVAVADCCEPLAPTTRVPLA